MSSHPKHLHKKFKNSSRRCTKRSQSETIIDARGGREEISFRMHSNHFGVYLRLHTTHKKRRKNSITSQSHRVSFLHLLLLLHSSASFTLSSDCETSFSQSSQKMGSERERLRQWVRARRHEFGLRWKHDLWVFHESPALFWWNFTQFPHTIDERKSRRSHDGERTADLCGRESRTDEIFIEKSPIVWNCLRQ